MLRKVLREIYTTDALYEGFLCIGKRDSSVFVVLKPAWEVGMRNSNRGGAEVSIESFQPPTRALEPRRHSNLPSYLYEDTIYEHY